MVATWLLCAFVCQVAFASNPPRITFQSLQEGLSNQVITCIMKDHKGYMWFGTYSGLNKYDGTNFVVYENHPGQARSISHNVIDVIIEDQSHRLWVGTSNGLNVYNREKDRFELAEGLGKTDTVNVKALFCDKAGKIWIGTAGDGLFVYDPTHKKLKHYVHDPANRASIGSNFVNAITADHEQNIWIGTRDGLDLFQEKGSAFTHFVSQSTSGLSHNTINCLVTDRTGSVWIGTYGGGLNKLLKKDNGYCFQQFKKDSSPGSLSNDYILSLLLDKQGNLWVGTENGGLNCLLPQTGSFMHFFSEEGNSQSLSSNSIWSLYEDTNGVLWVGTYYKGLNIYDPSFEKFQTYQRNGFKKKTLASNQVRAFAQSKDGHLWIATDGGGISYFDTRTRQFSEPVDNSRLSSKAVLTILYDSNETLWAGTWGGGIDRFSKEGTKLKNYRFDGALKNGRYNVNCLYEDRSGRIWAGTSGNGLFLYQPACDCFVQIRDTSRQSHLEKASYVNTILEDRRGQLWIGTAYGLVRMKTGADGTYSFGEYLYNSNPSKGGTSLAVNILFEDSKGNLWFGTVDDLNLFNPERGSFTIFNKQNGLPGNTIKGILEDKAGNLWISTNNGLSMFNPSTRVFKNYSRGDGLISDEFYPRACIRTRDGELFFGGNNGMLSFSTAHLVTNRVVPPVYITGFNLFNTPVAIGAPGSPLQKSIEETTQVTLTHRQTSFSIEFVALNFTHASRNQYAYMLEGFDKDWNQAGNRPMATYTNLDAGTYVFKVKGSNNEGVWNPAPTTLQITILPPLWATPWAYTLYALVVVALLWTFFKLRMLQVTQAQKLKMEQMNRAKNEELNRLKVQFFTNVSHELRTPLTLILSPLEQMMAHDQVNGDLKNKVNLVYSNAERLFGLVNELMDFTKLEETKLKMKVQKGDICTYVHKLHELFAEQAQRRQIDYRFLCQDESIEAWFDKTQMEKVILNLISNAFKYTPDQGIILVGIERVAPAETTSLSHVSGYVKISVTDNGSGISPQYIDKIFDRFFQSPEDETRYNTGTGIGLALVKSLVELHQGTITVKSEKWVKTCFEVMLPLGNAHFDPNELVAESLDYRPAGIGPVHTPVAPKNTSPQAPVILIVEDNFALRAYLASILATDYRVIEASDGELGFQTALQELPDLIISDIVMPRCGGIELCKKVKADIRVSHIPVILLTAKATIDDQITGIETGADAYVTKPFSIQLLCAQINQLIESRRELCAHFSQDVYLRPDKLADNGMDQQFLQKITDYILHNLTDSNLSVEGMAEAVNLSRSNMYRKIKALTGTSAVEFIRIIRLKQALKLMETRKHSLAEIAYLTGFTSPAYFTKSFKEHYGKPPSEYLRS